jgi:hypothetical protein
MIKKVGVPVTAYELKTAPDESYTYVQLDL